MVFYSYEVASQLYKIYFKIVVGDHKEYIYVKNPTNIFELYSAQRALSDIKKLTPFNKIKKLETLVTYRRSYPS